MNPNAKLPSPGTAALLTLGSLALILAGFAFGYLSNPAAERGSPLFLLIVPLPTVIGFFIAVRGIRAFERGVTESHAGAMVFFAARTEPLHLALTAPTTEKGAWAGRHIGVSVDDQGLFLWSPKNTQVPMVTFDWNDVLSVDIGGTPIDMAERIPFAAIIRQFGWRKLGIVAVPALTIVVRRGSSTVTLPLALYSARTAYPTSRQEFAAIVTNFLKLRSVT
ncbi:MAG: hypothetical protein R6W83_07000 [Cryobacterium sp.]